MKILVVGGGGREHTLLWKLKQSPLVEEVFCAPGNAGTAIDGTNVDIKDSDIEGLLAFAKQEKIDLTVVGPEAPLVAGIADTFASEGLKVFGPSKAAAQMEGSKVFTKRLLRKANVRTADYDWFDNAERAMHWLEQQEDRPWVVKADGLAAGKGAIVCKDRAEAIAAVRLILVERAFGRAGDELIIEECLVGQETSILAIVDGNTILTLESSQDHKRALDNDEGPNTGGMGAYCPTPLVSPELMDEIVQDVLIPTIHSLSTDEIVFRGILYAGIMLTDDGPSVLEYNVRFGDPETQPILMRLKSDLAEILLAAAEGRLDQIEPLEWDPRPAVCVVMASEGYPGSYQKGRVISGITAADELEDTKVFHAGTALVKGQVVNNGGRVLGVTCLGDTVADAKRRAYEAVEKISWNGGWCRSDISDKVNLIIENEADPNAEATVSQDSASA
jgi:phosphoribosylamine--glycine ligase